MGQRLEAVIQVTEGVEKQWVVINMLHDTEGVLLHAQVTQEPPDQMARSQFIQRWSFYELASSFPHTNTVELQPGN